MPPTSASLKAERAANLLEAQKEFTKLQKDALNDSVDRQKDKNAMANIQGVAAVTGTANGIATN